MQDRAIIKTSACRREVIEGINKTRAFMKARPPRLWTYSEICRIERYLAILEDALIAEQKAADLEETGEQLYVV